MATPCQPQRPPYCDGCDAPNAAGFPVLSEDEPRVDPLVQALFQKFEEQRREQQEWMRSTLFSTLKDSMDVMRPHHVHERQISGGSRAPVNRPLRDAKSKFWDRYDEAVQAGRGWLNFEDTLRATMLDAQDMLLNAYRLQCEKQHDASNSQADNRSLIHQHDVESHKERLMASNSHSSSFTADDRPRAQSPPYHSESPSSVADDVKVEVLAKEHVKKPAKRAYTLESLAINLPWQNRGNGLQSVYHEYGYSLNDAIADAVSGVNIETKRLKLSYWGEIWAKLSVGSVVESLMGLLVVLDCVVMGVKTEYEQNTKLWLFWDTGIAVVFLIERFVRILVSGCRMQYCGPGASWNIFETVLVLSMFAELVLQFVVSASSHDFLLTALRLLRLGRFVRIFRLSRLAIFSDLMMMLTGAAGGVKTLFWSIVLISMPLYMVSLILTSSLEPVEKRPNDGSKYFSSLTQAFFTMFRCVVASECTDESGRPIFVLLATRHGWQYAALYCVTQILMTFGLFNVIVAIYVENTVAAAKTNASQKRRTRLMDNLYFTQKTTELVEFCYRVLKVDEGFAGNEAVHDIHGDLCFSDKLKLEITPQGFAELREFKEFQDLLRDLDIADESQLDFFKTLDVDGGGND